MWLQFCLIFILSQYNFFFFYPPTFDRSAGGPHEQAEYDACVVTPPYVLLPLKVCQLSQPGFERYFYELTSVFTAAAASALVTVEE